MISVLKFKKKYPRQYKWLIEYYGGRRNIFDLTAAIILYLQGAEAPKCEVCQSQITISKKYRNSLKNPRCAKHVNTNLIISKEELFKSETQYYKVVKIPNKHLTRTDKIDIECSKHGIYTVNIGNFISGMQCQKCYGESLIGHKKKPHSVEVRRKLSQLKLGKKMNLSDEAKESKSKKQKDAWARRKNNKEEYALYISKLSQRQKNYLEKNGHSFPNKEKTRLEIQFEEFLKKHNIQYVSQYILEGKKFDFYLVDMQLLVEVDGEYWHRLDSSIKNDTQKHEISLRNNIQLLRISSDDFRPELIFENKTAQNDHTRQILIKRKIYGF